MMSNSKEMAITALNELHSSIPYAAYSVIFDALTEIDTLRDRDEELEELWQQFADVPMNPETECLEEPFLGWGKGIHREEIWHWFDKRHSKGVAYLLYNDGVDRTDEIAKLLYLKQLCHECDVDTCRYFFDGKCRFALVHERKPIARNNDCEEFDYYLKEDVK